MLVERLANLRERQTIKRKPLFFKIAPELTLAEIRHMVRIALSAKIDGFVIGNTTTERPNSLRSPNRFREGGLSGRPVFAPSTALLGRVFQESKGQLSLIGVGGIFSAEDLYEKIKAGASLCQIYTCLYYKGPHIVPTLLQGLARLLTRDGYKNVSEAVGAAHFSQTRPPVRHTAPIEFSPIPNSQPKSAVA
jgi:dihydroorotate dehydrogenase